MAKHVHADNMRRYAADAAVSETPWDRWQVQSHNGVWINLNEHPSWHEKCVYRRKPLNINGINVPEPTRVTPEETEEYYYVDFSKTSGVANDIWNGFEFEVRLLNNGFVHLTREAAQAHSDALMSFTKVADR